MNLPDEELQDQTYRIRSALNRHQRDEAGAILLLMEAVAATHWLTLHARLFVAGYDGNTPLCRQCLDSLLLLFPDDPRLLLQKLDHLREYDDRDERLALLQRLCGQTNAHPAFLVRYAEELFEDARERSAANYWVRRALRYGDEGLTCLANRQG